MRNSSIFGLNYSEITISTYFLYLAFVYFAIECLC